MRIVKPGEKISKKEIKYWAEMAAEAYADDPVHSYATKNIKLRKRYIYHFMMNRITASNSVDYFYIDDDKRGICIWRKAHNEYTVLDFLKCPHWIPMWLLLPSTVKTLSAYSKLDVKKFDDDTWIISPVFVSPEHQGEGVATALISQGVADLTAMGLKCGLEAQSEKNVRFYEKLGFKTFEKDYYKSGNIEHRYMIYGE